MLHGWLFSAIMEPVVYQVRNCKLRMEEDLCKARRTTPPCGNPAQAKCKFLAWWTTTSCLKNGNMAKGGKRAGAWACCHFSNKL